MTSKLHDGHFWDLPGGHINDMESPAEGLAREIQEETGLTLVESEDLFATEIELGGEHKPVLFYSAKATGEIKLSEEHTDYAWVSLEESKKYNLGVFHDMLDKIFEEDFDLEKAIGSTEIAAAKQRGLVPQSGDWNKPGRWVRSKEEVEEKEGVSGGDTFENRLSFLYQKIVIVGKQTERVENYWNKQIGKMLTYVAKLLPISHMQGINKIRVVQQVKGGKGNHAAIFQGETNNIIIDGWYLKSRILIHEIGHTIQARYLAPILSDELDDEVKAAYDEARDTDTGFVSEYAKDNFLEFFAESYVQYFLGNEELRQRNPKIADIIDRVTVHLESSASIQKATRQVDGDLIIEDPPEIGEFDPNLPDLQEKEYDHGIVAFPVPKDIASQIALEDLESPEKLHVTLAYMPFGDADDTDWWNNIQGVVKKIGEPPMDGRIIGLKRFRNSSDEEVGKDAFVALVDIPGIQSWRKLFEQYIEDTELSVNNKFKFTPHITLAYLDADEEDPIGDIEKLELQFENVEIWANDEHRVVDFDEPTGLEKAIGPMEIASAKQRGLVPQTGDWNAPGRWVRAREAVSEASGSAVYTADEIENKVVPLISNWKSINRSGDVIDDTPEYANIPLDRGAVIQIILDALDGEGKINPFDKGETSIPKWHIDKLRDIDLVATHKNAEDDMWGGSIVGEVAHSSKKMSLYDLKRILVGGTGLPQDNPEQVITRKFPRGINNTYLELMHTVVHELAHCVATEFLDIRPWLWFKVENLYNQAMRTYRGHGGSNQFVSHYASRNANEFFAECYRAYIADTHKLRTGNPGMFEVMELLATTPENKLEHRLFTPEEIQQDKEFHNYPKLVDRAIYDLDRASHVYARKSNELHDLKTSSASQEEIKEKERELELTDYDYQKMKAAQIIRRAFARGYTKSDFPEMQFAQYQRTIQGAKELGIVPVSTFMNAVAADETSKYSPIKVRALRAKWPKNPRTYLSLSKQEAPTSPEEFWAKLTEPSSVIHDTEAVSKPFENEPIGLEKAIGPMEIATAKQKGLVPQSGNWNTPGRWVKPKQNVKQTQPSREDFTQKTAEFESKKLTKKQLERELSEAENIGRELFWEVMGFEERLERLQPKGSKLVPGILKKLKSAQQEEKAQENKIKQLKKLIQTFEPNTKIESVLAQYTGDTLAYNINKSLRQGKPEKYLSVPVIDDAIKKYGDVAITTRQKLFRKVSLPFKMLGISSLQEAVGLVFTDKAFISTTSSKEGLEAIDVGTSGEITPKTEGVIEIIKAPADIKGLDLMSYSEYPEEMEVLLPRDLTFRIVSAKISTRNYISWFKAEIV